MITVLSFKSQESQPIEEIKEEVDQVTYTIVENDLLLANISAVLNYPSLKAGYLKRKLYDIDSIAKVKLIPKVKTLNVDFD